MRAWLFITMMVVACSRGGRPEVPTMTVDEVASELAAKTILAVDVCHPDAREHFGVVPGAILLPDLEDYPINLLPADHAAKLVFYCSGPG